MPDCILQQYGVLWRQMYLIQIYPNKIKCNKKLDSVMWYINIINKKTWHTNEKYCKPLKLTFGKLTYTGKQYKMEFDHAHLSVDRIPDNHWLLFHGVSVSCDYGQSVTTKRHDSQIMNNEYKISGLHSYDNSCCDISVYKQCVLEWEGTKFVKKKHCHFQDDFWNANTHL